METKIKDFFATILKIPADELNDAATPHNLETWDSLHHMFLVSGFEEEFNISIEPEEAVDMYKDFKTFKDIVMQKIK